MPYGYKKLDKDTTVIDEEKAPLVKRAFELYATGLSLSAVRDKLKEENYFYLPSTPIIGKAQLHSMLKNINYTGVLKFKDEIYAGKHEAIISKELFEKAQISAKKIQKPLYRNELDFSFSNLMKCANVDALSLLKLKKVNTSTTIAQVEKVNVPKRVFMSTNKT